MPTCCVLGVAFWVEIHQCNFCSKLVIYPGISVFLLWLICKFIEDYTNYYLCP